MFRSIYTCCVCLLLLPGWVRSQQVFEHITTLQGLSNNVVHSVLQDTKGFYWISTTDGLNRFDGSAFKIFRNEKNDPYSLANNYCTAIMEDQQGDIWIATYNGISIYRKKEGKFQNIYLQQADFKPDILNRISLIEKDDEGNMWVVGHGVWKYDIRGNLVQKYLHNPGDKSSISDNGRVIFLAVDKINKGLWVQTTQEMNFFDFATQTFLHKNNNPKEWKIFELNTVGKITYDKLNHRFWYYNQDKQGLCFIDLKNFQDGRTVLKSEDSPRAMYTDFKGRLWVSLWQDSDGTFIFDPVTETIDSNFLDKFHPYSPLSPRFNSFYCDPADNIWICSNRGVSVYNESQQFFNLYEIDESATHVQEPINIYAIAPSNDGTVWVGCNKKGLYSYETYTRKLRKINNPLIDETITSIYLENDSTLWCISTNTLFKMHTRTNKILKQAKLDYYLHFVTGDDFGHIWVGDWNNGLYKLNKNAEVMKHFLQNKQDPGSLPFNNLICFNNKFKELWIGLNGGSGFAQYDYSKDQFNHFNTNNDSTNNQFGTINSIATADKNIYLIGTHGGGIYLWNRQTNTYKQFDQSDGLDGNFINSVLTDKNGNYWVTTSNGINFFNGGSHKFSPLKIDFSFRTNAFRKNGEEAPDGSLFMFCGNKILQVKPSVYKVSETSRPTLISSFKVFDQDLSSALTDKFIRLTYKQNFFSFEYSALKTNPGADIRYAYKLEGFDANWNEAGNRRFAAYTNVPAGSYRFLVKSSNEAGEWSEKIANIMIVISPPFWKTWWFISFIAFLFSAGIYSVYRYRVGQIKKIHLLRSRISQDLHDDVGATLSGIKVFSQLARERPESSKEYLEKINNYSDEMLTKMSDIVWFINTDHDSFEHLMDKLRSYALTITSARNIQLEFHADTEIKKKIPDIAARKNIYLIAKEAINNAVKHAGSTLVQINLKAEKSGVRLTVADNGKGFIPKSMNGGNGLSNMRKRAEEMNGVFLLETAPGGGTLITVTF